MFPPAVVPLTLVAHEIPKKHGVSLYIKREDLIHKEIAGNKWRKLRYNLQEALKQGHKKILTFGGAFSNHIAATAFAGKQYGIETIGVIRGTQPPELSYTLQTAMNCGMKLLFVTRAQYKTKEDGSFMEILHQQYGNFYLIPEGGANTLGVKGCEEIVPDIGVPFDHICCPCGTGTTLAGIINGLDGNAHAIGFSALKAEGYFEEEIKNWLHKPFGNWHISYDYHFGGYAKAPGSLKDFIRHFYRQTNIPLDGVYTGKMLFGIMDLIQQGYFDKGSTIVAVHTGGLQGNAGLGIHFNHLREI